MIYLQAGRQRFEYQDDRKPAVFDHNAGEGKWSPPEGMHAPEVISDEPFNIIEVELKKPGGGKKITNLDPSRIDPKHYKIEFENQQVRVIRARMGPHESVPLHEHTLNRVIVLFTDLNLRSTDREGNTKVSQQKAGGAAWSTPITHKEENLNGSPFEVIAIEIKE